MEGQAYINNKDIWTNYGAILRRGAYEALLTPAAVKPYITTESRLQHGKRYVASDNAKMQEREITLNIFIEGESEEQYLERYEAFLNAITNGVFELKVPRLKRVFKFVYLACAKYGDYGIKKGNFALRLSEPNPKDRPLISEIENDDY